MGAIQRMYKNELGVTSERHIGCKKRSGAARCACNWGLHRKQEKYCKMGESPSVIDLYCGPDATWLYEVSRCVPQEALRNSDWPVCGVDIDRDLNAAKDQEKLAGSSLDIQNACGGGAAGGGRVPALQRSSVKQEPDAGRGLSTCR